MVTCQIGVKQGNNIINCHELILSLSCLACLYLAQHDGAPCARLYLATYAQRHISSLDLC